MPRPIRPGIARFALAAALAAGLFAVLLPSAAEAQTTQQALVDRATLTLQDMASSSDSSQLVNTLKKARAVLLWFALAHNLMQALALRQARQTVVA